jgi:hypothetical protein
MGALGAVAEVDRLVLVDDKAATAPETLPSDETLFQHIRPAAGAADGMVMVRGGTENIGVLRLAANAFGFTTGNKIVEGTIDGGEPDGLATIVEEPVELLSADGPAKFGEGGPNSAGRLTRSKIRGFHTGQ